MTLANKSNVLVFLEFFFIFSKINTNRFRIFKILDNFLIPIKKNILDVWIDLIYYLNLLIETSNFE